jgi:Holliday junction DNA helicase RuvA
MIASLRGVVQRVGELELVLELAGVGLHVAVPAGFLRQEIEVGDTIFLFTHLIVREDALTLYGFPSTEQRSLFVELMSVSGVGPRLALAILSHLSGDVLRSAVVNNQPGVLAQVPGVGKKTAEKLVFHLKDRMQAPEGMPEPIEGLDSEVVGVLTALGYSIVEAQTAVQSIPQDFSEDIEDRVRLALRYFAKP